MEKPSNFFSRNKNAIAWIIRIVIFILFLVSALAKMYKSIVPLEPSIWGFEKQLVDLGICDWCWAHYLARIIIGIELALAFAILQPHLLKKIVIPVTIALLAAFCIHLGIQMAELGIFADSNCGCFGELIPMTPFEAFVKNIIAIGLLVWLFKLLPTKKESWRNMINLIAIFLACALFMFIAFPFCPCGKENPNTIATSLPLKDTAQIVETETKQIDSIQTALANDSLLSANEKQRIQDSLNLAKTNLEKEEAARKKAEEERKVKEAEEAKKAVAAGPKAVVSRFATMNTFSGKKVNVDQGKKTICMFAPGCDHCQHTAKLLGELAKKGNTPPVFIYFMDEEPEKIPEFFEKAGVTFPYQVLGIGNFWDLLSEGSTPGVFGMWNGNIIQTYEGIAENEFDLEKFKKFALPQK